MENWWQTTFKQSLLLGSIFASLQTFKDKLKPTTGALGSILQKIAFAGRLMQSHFSPNDIFDQPVDIEWLANKDGVYFLQLRPYAK